MERKVIEIVAGVARHPAYRMNEPVNFLLNAGEQLAIVGPNGSGKTMLVNTIIGRYPLLINEVHYNFGADNGRMAYENIRYIAFRDSYGDSDANYYYQQRWHSQDVELSPTVREQFSLGMDDESAALCEALFRDFAIDTLMDKLLVMLSSGELRRLQIVKALMTSPRVLIMDNPFIGLDAMMRQQLCSLLKRLIDERGMQLILVLSREDEIPDFVTHIVPVYNKMVGDKVRNDYVPMASSVVDAVCSIHNEMYGLNDGEPVIELKDVTLRYGERTIFEHLNWTVCRGERWALHGRNGSGKSALLSLVCADNPQSYACNISLFGQRRGMGESIWDIKKRIGYVSPEMHRAYLKDFPAIEIVASGLHDSIGLYKRPRPEQDEVCKEWMRVFGVVELANRPFLTLSSGEQRLVLLARAFVKDPELLILDEPLHGLDTQNRERVRSIIDEFCARPEKTLVMVTHYPEELPSCITHHKKL